MSGFGISYLSITRLNFTDLTLRLPDKAEKNDNSRLCFIKKETHALSLYDFADGVLKYRVKPWRSCHLLHCRT
ncbi:hypothetical protein KQQSB11_260490 [Klebsiella quasipneumoniae subsp. quasipneumoniae]|nr:hypothetical protein KQQSB11_260490 [Klebsiella quasipneumoniae subsp. quasipneumoniae]